MFLPQTNFIILFRKLVTSSPKQNPHCLRLKMKKLKFDEHFKDFNSNDNPGLETLGCH